MLYMDNIIPSGSISEKNPMLIRGHDLKRPWNPNIRLWRAEGILVYSCSVLNVALSMLAGTLRTKTFISCFNIIGRCNITEVCTAVPAGPQVSRYSQCNNLAF